MMEQEGKLPIVSVVMPVYNGEKYLRESLDSILSQTLQNWELICVDDCSKDSTSDILREYAQRDPRIKVIRNTTNQRLPKSLNIGFLAAKGDFFTWTSDDNMYLPEALQTMQDVLIEHSDVPMVVADMELVDEKGTFCGMGPRYDRRMMYRNNCVGACFMYRQSVPKKIGEYDAARFLVEDYDYWLRVQASCGEILRIPQTLYRYRLHEGSLTTTRKKEITDLRIELLTGYFQKIEQEMPDGLDHIIALYFEGWVRGVPMERYRSKFIAYIPEIAWMDITENDRNIPKENPIALFGSGEQGRKAHKKFGQRVVAFLDNDEKKLGTELMGVPILLPDTFIKANPDVYIIVSVDFRYMYEIVRQLYAEGVKKIGIFCE